MDMAGAPVPGTSRAPSGTQAVRLCTEDSQSEYETSLHRRITGLAADLLPSKYNLFMATFSAVLRM